MLSALLFRDSVKRLAIDDEELLPQSSSADFFDFFDGGGAILENGLDNQRGRMNLEIKAVFTDKKRNLAGSFT